LKLIGVDVGFSEKRKTTGIACLDDDKLYCSKAGTSWESRKTLIPSGFQPKLIALDGPLLPQGVDELVHRQCEFAFIDAPFSSRCKPGLSHWGTGLKLRRAAEQAAAQFGQLLGGSFPSAAETFVRREGPIVEAFPNAFLGVLLSEEDFQFAPKPSRGKRFDWLYERAVGNRRLESILAESSGLPSEFWRRLNTEKDHDLRASLICLLTAAFAAKGTASIIGEAESGWFWLPPSSVWQSWARDGLRSSAAKRGLNLAAT